MRESLGLDGETGMSAKPALICGNWGGTALRVYCLDENGRLCRDLRFGRGINQLTKAEQKAHWFDLVSDLPKVPYLICGSAGSNLGWLETGYVGLPVSLNAVASNVAWFDFDEGSVGIVPGVKAENPLGEPDTMRSEETEILGFLENSEATRQRVLCLPGTHNKWITVIENEARQFFTSLTGETFHALNKSTVITRGSGAPTLGAAFDQGVKLGLNPKGALLQKLYSVRSRQIDGSLAAGDSASFLSGLLIGADILGAKEIIGVSMQLGVTIIGGDPLGESFERALKLAEIPCDQTSGDDAGVAGFAAIGRKLGLLSDNPRI
jgi:2-dehydro-3-deoxygalactonokinase